MTAVLEGSAQVEAQVDVPALALASFAEIEDVRVRRALLDGADHVWSGVLHSTMLELSVAADGKLSAGVVGVCPGCEVLVAHPDARIPVRLSASSTAFLPAPVLRSSVDFCRVYGQRPVDAVHGPVGFGSTPCPACRAAR